MPFPHDAFLDVFGVYNSLLWPEVALLWVVTAGLVWHWLRSGRLSGRAVFALLAVHWAWSGVVYHWYFFRDINPAASFFAALFVLQAVLFTRHAVASKGYATATAGLRGVIGATLVLYGLIYPVVGFGFGLEYPRLPLFAVPCPTTLVTAGLLVTTVGAPPLSQCSADSLGRGWQFRRVCSGDPGRPGSRPRRCSAGCRHAGAVRFWAKSRSLTLAADRIRINSHRQLAASAVVSGR